MTQDSTYIINYDTYVPFEDNNIDFHKENNFCPLCHRNYNSHYHKTICNQEHHIPISDNICILLVMLWFYFIYKIFSRKK